MSKSPASSVRVLLFTALFTLCLGGVSLPAQGSINSVPWDRLSDRDISPEGRSALSMNEKDWRHAETEHFVYHFTDEKQAETVYIHAEVYYKWIKDFFGVTEDRWSKKNHIFVFADKSSWETFLGRVAKGESPAAYTDGWELYMHRAEHWVSPRMSLAHEMTHVIVFRFMDGPLPIFLNEGFACLAATQLVKMQLESSNYELSPIEPISEAEFIPLKEISSMTSYPKDRPGLELFYRESEYLARFLAFTYGKDKYYELLRAASKGEDFSRAVSRIYSKDMDTIESEFKKYARPR